MYTFTSRDATNKYFKLLGLFQIGCEGYHFKLVAKGIRYHAGTAERGLGDKTSEVKVELSRLPKKSDRSKTVK